jgi:folate-binding protein YgfZ
MDPTAVPPEARESFGDSGSEYAAARTAAAIFNISSAGKVEVTGPEAPDFLHNLCTNDVKSLAAGAGCEAFFCNARARVLFLSRVYHVRPAGRDALWVDVWPGPGAPLMRHLDRHLIAEQVELSDRTDEFAQYHVAGPDAPEVLGRAIGEPLPGLAAHQNMERSLGESVAHIRRHDALGLPGYDVVCRNARAADVWRRLTVAGARPAGAAAFEWLRVEAGMPLVGRDMDDARFVVELNRPDAISFTKGCYLGQEPIVMARDRAGFVARSFRGLRLANSTGVEPGAQLFGPAEAGVVTSFAVTPGEGPIALGFVRRGFDSPDTELRVGQADAGVPATVSRFPIRRPKAS